MNDTETISGSRDYQDFGPKNKANQNEMECEDFEEIPQEDIITESTLTDSNTDKTVNTVNESKNKTNPPTKNTVNTDKLLITVNKEKGEVNSSNPMLKTVNETVKSGEKTVKNEVNSFNRNNSLTVDIDKAKFSELYVSRIRKDLGIQRRASIFLIESFIESESMSRDEITEYLISKGVTKTTAYQVPTDLKKAKILIEDNGRFSMNSQRVDELLKEYTSDVSPDTDQVIIDDDFKDWLKSILNESGELEVDLDLIPEKYKTMALQDPDKFLGEVSQNNPRPESGEIKTKFINIRGPRKLLSHTIKAEFMLKLIEVKGAVFAMTDRIPRVIDAIYACERCGEYHNKINGNLWEDPPKPVTCSNPACGRNGPFKLMETLSKFTDIRIATVRSEGDESKGLVVVFKDEDALLIERGMRLNIQGILRRRKNKTKKGENSYYYLEAINFEEYHHKDQIYDKDEVKKYLKELGVQGRTFLTECKEKAFTRIAGMDAGKEASILSLVAPHWKGRGVGRYGFERDNIHVLLVSDYGQGKGMFQRCIKDLEDVGEISGGHCTKAGLISATTNDPETGLYMTIPGTLPKYDGKHVVINELQNVPIDLLANLREAVEDGITHVDKANTSEKIISRVTCIAFANYGKGFIEKGQESNPRSQIKWIDTGFLSRMDILLFAYDDPMDDDLTTKIINAKNKEETDLETIKKLRMTIAYMRDLNPIIPKDLQDGIANATNKILKQFKEVGVEKSRGRIIRTISCLSRAYARLDDTEIVSEDHIMRAMNIINLSFESKTALNMSIEGEVKKAQAERIKDVFKLIVDNTTTNKGITIEDIVANFKYSEPEIRSILKELLNKEKITVTLKGEYKSL